MTSEQRAELARLRAEWVSLMWDRDLDGGEDRCWRIFRERFPMLNDAFAPHLPEHFEEEG